MLCVLPSLIDNILTKDIFNNSVKKSWIKEHVSDHFPISSSIQLIEKKHLEDVLTIKKRVFNERSITYFKEQLSLTSLERHVDFNCYTNEIYDFWKHWPQSAVLASLYWNNFLEINKSNRIGSAKVWKNPQRQSNDCISNILKLR